MHKSRDTQCALDYIASNFSRAITVLAEEIAKGEGTSELSRQHLWEAFDELTANNAAIIDKIGLGYENQGDAMRGADARTSE